MIFLFFNDLLPNMVMLRDTDSFLENCGHHQLSHSISGKHDKFGAAATFRIRVMTSQKFGG